MLFLPKTIITKGLRNLISTIDNSKGAKCVPVYCADQPERSNDNPLVRMIDGPRMFSWGDSPSLNDTDRKPDNRCCVLSAAPSLSPIL
jgi:hypothetical protein